MNTFAGNCGKCGAPFTVPAMWMSITPPPPTPTCACWNMHTVTTTNTTKVIITPPETDTDQ